MPPDRIIIPIDAEARGKLRAWKAAAAKRWTALQRALDEPELQRAAADMTMKTGTGRQRAFAKIQKRIGGYCHFEGARLDGSWPLAIWASLEPRGSVALEPGEPSLAQDCVTVDYIVAGNLPHGPALADGMWSLEIPDHALGRLLQRQRAADLGTVLLAAHHAALRSRVADVAHCFADPDQRVLLPTRAGCFVSVVALGRDPAEVDSNMTVHIRALTWLSNDQLTDEQERDILLTDDGPGERLGQEWLAPAPLRRITYSNGRANVFIEPPGMPAEMFAGG
jgi:hypothetical protein